MWPVLEGWWLHWKLTCISLFIDCLNVFIQEYLLGILFTPCHKLSLRIWLWLNNNYFHNIDFFSVKIILQQFSVSFVINCLFTGMYWKFWVSSKRRYRHVWRMGWGWWSVHPIPASSDPWCWSHAWDYFQGERCCLLNFWLLIINI